MLLGESAGWLVAGDSTCSGRGLSCVEASARAHAHLGMWCLNKGEPGLCWHARLPGLVQVSMLSNMRRASVKCSLDARNLICVCVARVLAA